jgi:hypothetical protein
MIGKSGAVPRIEETKGKVECLGREKPGDCGIFRTSGGYPQLDVPQVRPMSAAETGVRCYGLDVGTVPGLRMDGELFNRVTWRHEI